jgi:hypothetical protein
MVSMEWPFGSTLQLALQQPGWTRTQRIRTTSAIPLDAAVTLAGAPPAYQRLAPRALRLHHLGLSDSAIGRLLGMTDKTVRKAIKWHSEPLQRDSE